MLQEIEFLQNALTDLLCLDAVHNRVHQRRCQQIDIGHEYVDDVRGMLPKAVYQGQTNHGNIEQEDSTEVGDTSVEGLETFLFGSDAQNSL